MLLVLDRKAEPLSIEHALDLWQLAWTNEVTPARSMPATRIASPNTAAASTPCILRSFLAATSPSLPVAV